jgi:signal transduction histidine kinase
MNGVVGWRPGLALRIYLVGLAQFAVIAIGLGALMSLGKPPRGPHDDQLRFVARQVELRLSDPAALEEELDAASADLFSTFVVVAADDRVVASSPPAAAPCTPGEMSEGDVGGPPGPRFGERLRRPPPWASGAPPMGPPTDWPPGHPPPPRPVRGGRVAFGNFCIATPLEFPDGSTGQLFQLVRRPLPPSPGPLVIGAVLLVVGVSSWLLARSLTRPLARLRTTARAIGQGALSARVRLARRDELGEVARAFDDMADRVVELFHAEKELLANVSHELRTPLSRIRVALDLAAEGDAQVAKESLAEISGDLDELERLIEDTLTAARLDLGGAASPSSGIPPLRKQLLEPATVLEAAAQRFRSQHPDRPLEVTIGEDLRSIEGDPVLLRRAIDNLLENAHKYTEAPTAPIELRASAGDALALEVVDHGIGISKEDLALVFRPFFRADRSRTRATGGLGLGLALTRRIVEAHGGTIAVDSVLDEGTRVRVTLPWGA